MTDRQFRFSVIMPIFNVEKYLEEAIESVINQDIGFEENIQLILINDGSRDASGDICSRYAARYPENIVYIDKENGGVSSARNEGLKHVRGEYVNFLDSDDTWKQGSFLAVDRFIREHHDIRVLFTGLKLTGRREGDGYHLDYQYKKTQIIDIRETYDYPQIRVATSFIARELLTEEFDSSITVGEDFLYINRILLDETRFAIVSDAVYQYRKRDDQSSTIDTAEHTMPFYTVSPEQVYRAIADMSVHKYGEVIPYVQYLLLTDLQWRIIKKPSGILTDEQAETYRSTIMELLRCIDDDIILSHRRMQRVSKIYALRLKNGDEAYFSNTAVKQTLSKSVPFGVTILEVDGKEIYISGSAKDKYIGDEYCVYALDEKGSRYDAEYIRYPQNDFTGIDPVLTVEGYRLAMRLPLRPGAEYSFYLTDGKEVNRKAKVRYGKLSRLGDYDNSFFTSGDYIVKRDGNKIKVSKRNALSEMTAVRRYCKEIREKAGEEAAGIWKEAYRLKKTAGKPIWIISDRSHIAGDNGEALFTYLMNTDIAESHDIYFLLDEKSEDFERLSRIGNVLRYGSREHYVRNIAASMIISSHADLWVTEPYGRDCDYYRNLMSFRYIFLQHGITQNDVSSWLHYLRKNIKLFITAARPEYISIIDGGCGYDPSVVKLTGFARYDKLHDDRRKVVAIAPTWRKYLATDEINGSVRGYFREFVNSDYFRFYNRLINDERLIDAMKDCGYEGIFYVHPAMSAQTEDFNGNDTIRVWADKIDYGKLIAESSLFVTDYSSVAMDFAYLKKPVIYSQFDKEEFFRKHLVQEGYYDYDTDGFGPVTRTYEETVDAIITAIRGGCREPEEYERRVDGFFAFTDRNNCARISAELIRLEEETNWEKR